MLSEVLSPLALSDEEYAALAELLTLHSSFDIDGLLGILHAVAVAPGLLPPSAWLSVVFPHGFRNLESGPTELDVTFALRLHNEVLQAVQDHYPLLPDEEDSAALESFAAGYAVGAKLDPLWYDDANRWTFASPIAYLGGWYDLVPADMLAKIESCPDPKGLIHRELAGLINAAQDSFVAVRRAATPEITNPPNAAALHPLRVGRNDPCPCGSRKKHKRCCLDRAPTATR